MHFKRLCLTLFEFAAKRDHHASKQFSSNLRGQLFIEMQFTVLDLDRRQTETAAFSLARLEARLTP